MMRRFTVPARTLGLLLMCGCAKPAPASPFAGTWTMSLGEHPFIVVTIRDDAGAYAGELARPGRFSTSDFVRFTGMSREVVTERISRADVLNGRLHFTTVNPRDASDITEYEMWRDEEQGARISISDVPAGFEPMRFTRAAGTAPAVFTGWEPGCGYQTGDVKAPSAEMQRIDNADQEPPSARSPSNPPPRDGLDPDATQEPYDRALISDALRRELGVPVLAAQAAQQRDWAKPSQNN